MSVVRKRIITSVSAILVLIAVAWMLVLPRVRAERESLEGLVRQLQAETPFYWRWVDNLTPFKWGPPPLGWRYKVFHWRMDAKMSKGRVMSKIVAKGTNAWPAIPALLDLMEHRNSAFGGAACKVLAGIKADECADWNKLAARLNGRHRSAQIFHYLFVSWSGLENRRYEETQERRFSLIGLAAAGTVASAAIPKVAALLNTKEDHEFWASAIHALRRMGGNATQFVPFLAGVLKDDDESPFVRASATKALGMMDSKTPGIRNLMNQAMEDERSSFVRLAAARALWKWKASTEEILPVLKPFLSHKLFTIRTGALNAISEMGNEARPIRSDVARLTSDENESVRLAAAAALKSIDGPSHLP